MEIYKDLKEEDGCGQDEGKVGKFHRAHMYMLMNKMEKSRLESSTNSNRMLGVPDVTI